MVIYDQDSKAILAEPLKTRAEHELFRTMITIHKHLKEHGLYPQIQILNNERPVLVKQFFEEENIQFQRDPPNLYCNNAVEKSIGTFKDYVINMLCSCNHQMLM